MGPDVRKTRFDKDTADSTRRGMKAPHPWHFVGRLAQPLKALAPEPCALQGRRPRPLSQGALQGRNVLLAFHCSSREALDNPVLENHDQDHERYSDYHRTRHDRSPGLLKSSGAGK